MACCAADVFCYVLIVCSSLQASQEKLNPVTRVCRCQWFMTAYDSLWTLEVNSILCSKITVLSLLWSQNTVNTSIFDNFWSKNHSPMRGRSGVESRGCCLESWKNGGPSSWHFLAARIGSGSMRRRWIDGISSWRDWPCVTEPQGKPSKFDGSLWHNYGLSMSIWFFFLNIGNLSRDMPDFRIGPYAYVLLWG